MDVQNLDYCVWAATVQIFVFVINPFQTLQRLCLQGDGVRTPVKEWVGTRQWLYVCEKMYSGGCFGICWCLWYWVTTAGGGSPVKWWCVALRWWNLSLQGNLSKEHNTTTGKCCRQSTSSCCWFSALPVSRSGTRLAQCWSLWTRWPNKTFFIVDQVVNWDFRGDLLVFVNL